MEHLKAMVKSACEIISCNVKNVKQTVGMAVIDLKKRYSSSSFGLAWAIIKPMLFVLVYWFGIEVGIRGGKSADSGVPFILWLIAGILPWFFVSEALVQCGLSIRSHRHLVTKSVFPIPTIPTFSELSLFFVHMILIGIATAIFIIYGFVTGNFFLDEHFIQIVYCLISLFVMMWTISVFFSALVVVSRDFEYLLKSATQILFWLSPILWDIKRIEKIKFIYYVVRINPITYVIGIYRDAFLGRWCFSDVKGLLCFWIEIIIMCFVSCFVFRRLQHEFADIL